MVRIAFATILAIVATSVTAGPVAGGQEAQAADGDQSGQDLQQAALALQQQQQQAAQSLGNGQQGGQNGLSNGLQNGGGANNNNNNNNANGGGNNGNNGIGNNGNQLGGNNNGGGEQKAGGQNVGNGQGKQFITGACQSKEDCASQCCAARNGGLECAAPGALGVQLGDPKCDASAGQARRFKA
ncbi:hypothetical protein XA68_13312 [Ophiocordyceps unilateralis]|uniref:Hydrophobin n=1 Tax=Ophiocordyceps unilateralis TaxID=268505 RepID=A0A2A9PBX6_OPHUN|nr:hypothetical protein XA68_13312 [Ophiocordyceps unilateralis]